MFKNLILSFMSGYFSNYISCAQDNDPNKISNDFQTLIDSGDLRLLSELYAINNEVFSIAVEYICRFEHSKNDDINHYYFIVETEIIQRIDERSSIYLTIEEYHELMNLHEYNDPDIEYSIHFSIYYHEKLMNKYSHHKGDPTGKCFSIILNRDYEFVKTIGWR